LSSRSLRASPLGDSAITVSFGTERSPQLLARIHAAARALSGAGIQFVDDIVPAYLALTVFYDADRASYDEIAARVLEECERAGPANIAQAAREHVIPVTYDGPDLDFVADRTGLSVDAVVARHSARTYSVDLLGFVPGFAYLSELDPALQLPRRAQPRPRVARGSVAIAAALTGVYPLDTPGGWHIIGATSIVMFDPARQPPVLLAPGDTVRFRAVS
jgi:KipI family sensor histidine kinase inhibitor